MKTRKELDRYMRETTIPVFVRLLLAGILAAQVVIIFTNVGIHYPWFQDLHRQLEKNNALMERLDSSLESVGGHFPQAGGAELLLPAKEMEKKDRIRKLEEQAELEFQTYTLYHSAGIENNGKTAVVDVNSTACAASRRSQHGEDMDMLRRFFSTNSPLYQVDGFFVEMGALDGLLYSNSYFYEHCLGWSGLLIEGQPENVLRLRRNRASPNVMRLGMAACDEDGGLLHFPSRGSAVSGSLDHMTTIHKDKWVSYFGDGQVDVSCGPLHKYFKLLGVKHINFFSLDVEGSELVVLKTIDWTQITIDVLMVELQKVTEKNVEIENLLKSVGYEKYRVPQRRRVLGPNMVFLPSHSPFLNESST